MIKKKISYEIYFPYLFFLFLVLTPLLSGNINDEFRTGIVINKVVCKQNPEQSYALYLPKNYSPASYKKWPLLFALDPAARGWVPLGYFKEAADLYGYIMVGSNNSRNGPLNRSVAAMKAVWQDIIGRFNIDRNRVYTTGFSGGSRGATILSGVVKNRVRGIIGCGAGISVVIKPEHIKPSLYYGLIGFADFNYLEMNELDHKFDQLDVIHHIRYYDGDHRYPPKPLCTEAMDWMELQGMRKGIIKRNDMLIQSLFERDLAKMQALEKSGNIYFAVHGYQFIVETYKEWKEISKIKNKIDQLRKKKAYKTFYKAEKKRLKKERGFKRNFSRAFNIIKNTPPNEVNMNKIFFDIKLHQLENGTKNDNGYDRSLTERLLFTLGDRARCWGDNHLKEKDYNRAIIYYKIGVKSSKKFYFYTSILYNMACTYSLNNLKQKALKTLKMAVDSGFKRPSLLENDKDLDPIRNEPKFKEILSLLKQKKD